MSKNKLFVGILGGLATVALVAVPALAHCGRCAEDCKEIAKQMDAGKVTAASMIAAAEAASKGKAVGFYMDLEKGKMDVDVHCLVGDKVQTVEVGADGKAGKMEEAKGVKGMADVAKSMDGAKLTLGKVVEAAEAASKGKALALVATAAGGKASYECYCLAGDKLMKVAVDDTGKAGKSEDAKMLPSAEPEKKPAPKGG